MSDMMKTIYTNIENLKFSVQFNRWDLTRDDQEAILARITQIESILDKAKNRGE